MTHFLTIIISFFVLTALTYWSYTAEGVYLASGLVWLLWPLWFVCLAYSAWRFISGAKIWADATLAEPKVKYGRGLISGVIGFILVYGINVFITDILDSNILTCNEAGAFHSTTLGVSSCGWYILFFGFEAVFAIISLVYLVKLIRLKLRKSA